jgi:hypothetical protein
MLHHVAEYETLEDYLNDEVSEENFDYDALTEQAIRDRLPEMKRRLASKQERLDQIEEQRRLDVARILRERKSASPLKARVDTPSSSTSTSQKRNLNHLETSQPQMKHDKPKKDSTTTS